MAAGLETPSTPPPPPPSAPAQAWWTSSKIRIATIVLWCVTFGLVVVSLIVLATASITVATTDGFNVVVDTAHFNDVYSYRYLMSSIVFGMLYALLQMFFKIYSFITGKSIIAGDAGLLFDFYGDKIISYLMATGAAAGLGATKDISQSDSSSFFDKAYVSCSLLLLAFFCTIVLSIFSSYALPRKL